MEKSFKSSTAQNHRTLPAPLEETVVRGRGRPRKRIQELLFLGKARWAANSLLPVGIGAGLTLLLPTPILSQSPVAELQTQRHLWVLLPFYLHISSFLRYCVKNLSDAKVHSCQNQINTTHKSGLELHIYCEQSFVSFSETGSLILLDYMKGCWSKHRHWSQPTSISRTAESETIGFQSWLDHLPPSWMMLSLRPLVFSPVKGSCTPYFPASCLPGPHLPLCSSHNDFLHDNSTLLRYSLHIEKEQILCIWFLKYWY